MYPNPAQNVLTIVAPEKATVELIDLPGKTVIAPLMMNAGEKRELNIDHLSNGTYLLKVTNSTSVSTQRIVITHE